MGLLVVVAGVSGGWFCLELRLVGAVVVVRDGASDGSGEGGWSMGWWWWLGLVMVVVGVRC